MLVELAEAFPGLVISTLFLIFALFDFSVAATAVAGNTVLAPAFFGEQLPVVWIVKQALPLTMPMFLLKLVKEDVMGLIKKGYSTSRLLGVGQLGALGLILTTVGNVLIPCITAVTTDDMTPEEATELYDATAKILALNLYMFVAGLVQMRLGAKEPAPAPAPVDAKKTD